MTINLDDPKLTAYALGELQEPERSVVAEAVAGSAEAQVFVQETQQLSRLLRGEFAADAQQAAAKPSNILPLPGRRSFWSDAQWMSIGVAALLAICAVVAAVILSEHRGAKIARPRSGASAPDVQMEVQSEPADGGEIVASNAAADCEDCDENAFVPAASNPVSTFPVNVGTASYTRVQRMLNAGVLPPRAAVRIEELVNYFTYDYPRPNERELFSINLEVAGCPWQPEHRLVRVGLRSGKTNAKEVRIQVEFNPARVESYRLLGFENRKSREASQREEAIASGRSVTALYEVVPVAGSEIAERMLSAKLQYRQIADDGIKMIERQLVDDGVGFPKASPDFRFAAAVAEFGMILRGSPRKGGGALGAVQDWARESKGADGTGARAEFLELVRKARSLSNG